MTFLGKKKRKKEKRKKENEMKEDGRRMKEVNKGSRMNEVEEKKDEER